ncbi:hypothetical protein AVEN_5801-1, partial [Araneus ventricosus]
SSRDLKKLLTDLELDDNLELGPSDLLRQRKHLTGNSIYDEVIKSVWLQRFPKQTQAILSISKDYLDNIAEMADKIITVYSTSEICPIAKVDSSPTSIDRGKLEALQVDIAALAQEFDEFSRNTISCSKSRELGGFPNVNPVQLKMNFAGIIVNLEGMRKNVYKRANF